jgi:hypothetical protein
MERNVLQSETGDILNLNFTNIADIIKWQRKNAPSDLATRVFRYHNCWAGLKAGDMLEISKVLTL